MDTEFELPLCEEHLVYFVMFEGVDGEPDFYDCPICHREDCEQLRQYYED